MIVDNQGQVDVRVVVTYPSYASFCSVDLSLNGKWHFVVFFKFKQVDLHGSFDCFLYLHDFIFLVVPFLGAFGWFFMKLNMVRKLIACMI